MLVVQWTKEWVGYDKRRVSVKLKLGNFFSGMGRVGRYLYVVPLYCINQYSKLHWLLGARESCTVCLCPRCMHLDTVLPASGTDDNFKLIWNRRGEVLTMQLVYRPIWETLVAWNLYFVN